MGARNQGSTSDDENEEIKWSCFFMLSSYVRLRYPPDIIQKPRPKRKHKKPFVLTTSSPTSPWIAEAPHLVGSLLAQETRARRVATFPRRRRPD